jgi:hypothetical protein
MGTFLLKLIVKFDSVVAAVNALRDKGQDLHEEARWAMKIGDTKEADAKRAEAEHLHECAKDIENAKYRALNRSEDTPE